MSRSGSLHKQGASGRTASEGPLRLLVLGAAAVVVVGAAFGLSRHAPAPLEIAGTRAVSTSFLAGFALGRLQVYFTRGQPAPGSSLRGGLDETFAADIDRATKSVDLAVFDLDLERVVDALLRAQHRGVTVRVIVDGLNLRSPRVADQIGRLQQSRVPVEVDRRPAFMHDKFAIFDAHVVWTGSWNPTSNDTYANENNMLRIDDVQVAHAYTRQFEHLIGARPDGVRSSTRIDAGSFVVRPAFAPENDITGDVTRLIAGARSSVDVLAFAFTSEPIANALIAAKRRGVRVRAVVERQNARGPGTVFDRLQRADLEVHMDGNCALMHDKVLIVDDRSLVTGSFNWTRQAQRANDENVVFVESAWLAQRYGEEFERIYNQALHPPRCIR